jgi:hypothetical protein
MWDAVRRQSSMADAMWNAPLEAVRMEPMAELLIRDARPDLVYRMSLD